MRYVEKGSRRNKHGGDAVSKHRQQQEQMGI